MDSHSQVLIYALCLAVLTLLYKVCFSKKAHPPGTKRLPGPRGVPILGSVPSLPQKHPWLQFYQWSKVYGPIYECNLAGINHVIISSPKIINSLLARRAKIYSDRPHIPAIMHDCRTSMHYIPLMGEGADHKRGRSFMKYMVSSTPHQVLSKLAEKESKALVTKLLDDPARWKDNVQNHIGKVTSQAAWNDDDIETGEKSVWNANNLIPRISPDGAIENKLPFLTKIPDWVPLLFQPWKAQEIARYNKERGFWLGQREKVRNTQEKSRSASWMEKFLFTDDGKAHGISDDDEAGYAIGMLAMIGSVLLSSPLQTLLLALCFYPEWQKKAQDEIDEQCGSSAPRAVDMGRLPTVRALIREVFRWRPPVPLGVPHVLEQDDIYDGYFIPKGTICLASEWAMTRDESLYPDPESFRPERWLDPSFVTYREPLSLYPDIKGHTSFGFGGRSCLGQGFSETVLFTMASTILWGCNITKKKDPKTGQDLEIPWMDIEPPNAIVRPTWFPLDVTARDEKKVQILKGE